MKLTGSMVAIVTPMDQQGAIDKKALHELVDWHLQCKTDAIIAVGTTGESATLDSDEQAEVISLIVKQVDHRIPVIAGTGTNSTQSTIKYTNQAKQLGADACLIVTPYYNKPTQQGLYEHYKLVAEKVDIPIILYNVPGRTACDMLPETVERLSNINNIIAIKEATGKLERANQIIARCDKNFAVYSGDDATALALMEIGAQGVISVTANVAPAKMHDLCEAALTGNMAKARKLNEELAGLHRDLFIEANPIPAKWVLYQLNKIQMGIRLPLLPLSAEHHETLKKAMRQAGLIQTENVFSS